MPTDWTSVSYTHLDVYKRQAVTITFSPEGAAVTASGCPDQVCVQTGQLTRAGESAICLPARVVLRLEGGGSGVDATVY